VRARRDDTLTPASPRKGEREKDGETVDRRLGLTVPLDGFSLAEHVEVVDVAERLGYRDAWSFEADGVDAFAPLAVAGQASGLRLGTAIVNVYTRGPATLAMSAAGLAEIAPGRFILGVGSGSDVIVESWNGGRFARPLTRVRETVQFLRKALAGERVVFRGETFAVDGFRLSRPPAAPVPIYLAALRAGMLALAGEVADGVILNWLGPADVPRCVAVVREAAEKAGRDPASIEITCRVFVHLDEDDTTARRHVAAYLNVPVYRAFHEWLGRTPALAPMWEAWGRGDRRAAVAAVPVPVMDALLLRGSVSAVRDGIQRYHDAGIDTVFLLLQSSEPDPAGRRERLGVAMRALAP
jgi:probable F420-dependent oxidoreductase